MDADLWLFVLMAVIIGVVLPLVYEAGCKQGRAEGMKDGNGPPEPETAQVVRLHKDPTRASRRAS